MRKRYNNQYPESRRESSWTDHLRMPAFFVLAIGIGRVYGHGHTALSIVMFLALLTAQISTSIFITRRG